MWTYNNEIYHHGILGMRWGKRNGPPYPLGSSDHSTSEKKAGWRKSLDKNRVTRIGVLTVSGAALIYGAMKYSDLKSTAKPAIQLGINFISTYNEKPQEFSIEHIEINPLKNMDAIKEAEDYTQELLKRNASKLGI